MDVIHVNMLRSVNIVFLVNAAVDTMFFIDEFCRAHAPVIQTIFVETRGLGGYVCATPRHSLRELTSKRRALVSTGQDDSFQGHLQVDENMTTVDDGSGAKHSRGQLLHIAFQGQNSFVNLNGHLPALGDVDASETCVAYAEAFCVDYGWPKLDDAGRCMAKLAALTAGYEEFYPCAAVLCGEACRRAISLSVLCFEDNALEEADLRKQGGGSGVDDSRDLLAMNLSGYAYFDCFALLHQTTRFETSSLQGQEQKKVVGNDTPPLNIGTGKKGDRRTSHDDLLPSDRKPDASPSEDVKTPLSVLLGKETVSKMRKCRLVSIGIGGVGGECLKMLACLGFSCAAKGGGCLVIDSGHVADRHFSRQWAYVTPFPLSRNSDASKVTNFCQRMKRVKSSFNIKGAFSHIDKAHSYPPSLERDADADPLNERWGNVDVVLTCVDSDACAEISDLCVLHETASIVGTCHEGFGYVQAFVPHRSLTFGDTKLCTEASSKLHSSNTLFPRTMKECVETALFRFEQLFSVGLRDFHMCCGNFKAWSKRNAENLPLHVQKERLMSLKYLVNLFMKPGDLSEQVDTVRYIDCIHIARWIFEAWFCHLPQHVQVLYHRHLSLSINYQKICTIPFAQVLPMLL
jgi:hypothetical protein